MLIEELNGQVGFAGQVLIRQLKRRDKLTLRRERQYDIITAYLQAAYVQEHIGSYISVLYTSSIILRVLSKVFQSNSTH